MHFGVIPEYLILIERGLTSGRLYGWRIFKSLLSLPFFFAQSQKYRTLFENYFFCFVFLFKYTNVIHWKRKHVFNIKHSNFSCVIYRDFLSDTEQYLSHLTVCKRISTDIPLWYILDKYWRSFKLSLCKEVIYTNHLFRQWNNVEL